MSENLNDAIKSGSEAIKNNSDESTSNLDVDKIANALNDLFKDGFDLNSIISKIQDTNLTDVIVSWIGNGENKPISAEAINDLFSTDKIAEFASSLGISEESAKKALSEVIPNLVDKITNGSGDFINDLLKDFGGIDGALNKLGNMFK